MKLKQGTAKARTNGAIPVVNGVKTEVKTPINDKEIQKEFNNMTRHLPISMEDIPMNYLSFRERMKARLNKSNFTLGMSFLALVIAIGSGIYAYQKDPAIIQKIFPTKYITKYITKTAPNPASKAKNVAAPNPNANKKASPSPNANTNPYTSPARNRTSVKTPVTTMTKTGNPNKVWAPVPNSSSKNSAKPPVKKKSPAQNWNYDSTPNQSSQNTEKDPDSSYANPNNRPPSSNNNNRSVSPAEDPVAVVE